MVSGRDTLLHMDTTLKSARRDAAGLQRQLQATSVAVSQNKLQQTRVIDRMAGIRLDAARRGEVLDHLQSATRDVERMLDARDDAAQALEARILRAGGEIEALEERRQSLHDEVDAAAKTLAEREAAVQRRLEQDDEFNAQLNRSRETESIAVGAREKAKLAEEDRIRKGEPYEADELFMYLWQRGYGTPEYAANPLTRLLDNWVARLCKYQDARPNYWMLREIPRRLEEHAEHARAVADAALDDLQDIEERAAREGDVPQARDALTALEEQQDEQDADIATAERALRELNAEQERYVAGQDDYTMSALRVFSAAMERKDVDGLLHLARATMTPEDDELVAELRELRQQHDEFQDELRDMLALQHERQQRIHELERVRRDFKRSRYDDLHSRFDKGDVLERMIGDVIAGAIQGGVLWKALRRYQRYSDAAGEWPDFGSGSVLRPHRRSKSRRRRRAPSWHWPGSHGGGSGFKIPRSAGRSGGRSGGRGGFRTGGGF